MEKQKWILDTDIGCDSDDCMALGWILARDDIELLAVTTVSGECENRGYLADVICRQAGEHIPIAAGSDRALDGRITQGFICPEQLQQVHRWEHGGLSGEPAVELMRRIIEENPHKITLAAIGQLTNIAQLFTEYPHIPGLLKDMVIMGGRFGECDTKRWGYTEWNILCDPRAAEIVWNADVPRVYIAGVELTSRFMKKGPEAAAAVGPVRHMIPVADAIAQNEETWFHDPVTLWAYVNRDTLSWKTGKAHIDFADPRGITTSFVEGAGRHCLLQEDGLERFFPEYAADLKIKWM